MCFRLNQWSASLLVLPPNLQATRCYPPSRSQEPRFPLPTDAGAMVDAGRRNNMTRYLVQMFVVGMLTVSASCNEAPPGAGPSKSSSVQLTAAACDADCCAACGLCHTGGKPGPCGVCSACRRAHCPICLGDSPDGAGTPASLATSGDGAARLCATDVDR
jgi:hypothetical protein